MEIEVTSNPMLVSPGNTNEHKIVIATPEKGKLPKLKGGNLYMKVVVVTGSVQINAIGPIEAETPSYASGSEIHISSRSKKIIAFIKTSADGECNIEFLE